MGLTSLPSLDGLAALQRLDLGCCWDLTSLPDVSSLEGKIFIENIPMRLFEWKNRGFVAYDIYTDGFPPVNALKNRGLVGHGDYIDGVPPVNAPNDDFQGGACNSPSSR